MLTDDDEHRLEEWFSTRLPNATGVGVACAYRLSSGHSNDTFAVEVRWQEHSQAREQTFVVRTSPEGPGLLEPYDIPKQYRVMSALAGSGVPVPAVHWLEEDPAVLGRPFFVMEKLDGEILEPQVPDWFLHAEPEKRRRMCEQFVEALAAVHNLDWESLGLDFLGDGANFLDHELNWWEAEIRKVQQGPLPAFERLLEWLRDNRPDPCVRVSLVHGDAKWANVMYRDEQVEAVLDWELATVGDPLVDVGYALVNWATSPGALRGGLDQTEFIALYEELTGLPVANRLWYENLSTFKQAAVLLRGSMLFATGQSDDLRYCWFGIPIEWMLGTALQKAGIPGTVETGTVMAGVARIADGFDHTFRTVILPELTSSEAHAQAALLPLAVRYLAAAASGTGFDVAAAFGESLATE